MGGVTIVKTADTLEELFSLIEEQIMCAENLGLGVDSELIVIYPGKQVADLFEVIVEYEETIPSRYPKSIKFEPVKAGRVFHIGVANMFAEKPKPGQLLGTVHVHT